MVTWRPCGRQIPVRELKENRPQAGTCITVISQIPVRELKDAYHLTAALHPASQIPVRELKGYEPIRTREIVTANTRKGIERFYVFGCVRRKSHGQIPVRELKDQGGG